MALTYPNIGAKLIEAFPQLRTAYDEVRKIYGEGEEPGPHVIVGDVLKPYLLSLIETKSDLTALQDAFNFLEQLASHPDAKVRNVVAVSVLEVLTPEERTATRPFLGPATTRILDDMEAWWKEAEARRAGGVRGTAARVKDLALRLIGKRNE